MYTSSSHLFFLFLGWWIRKQTESSSGAVPCWDSPQPVMSSLAAPEDTAVVGWMQCVSVYLRMYSMYGECVWEEMRGRQAESAHSCINNASISGGGLGWSFPKRGQVVKYLQQAHIFSHMSYRFWRLCTMMLCVCIQGYSRSTEIVLRYNKIKCCYNTKSYLFSHLIFSLLLDTNDYVW